MTTCLYVYVIGILLIVLAAIEWNKSERECRRAAAERRRKNEAIVAIRIECGSEIVRVDEVAKEEISACVPHEWPQPLEVGELFISCGSACKKAATCPVARRLLEPSIDHYVTAGDGFKLVKSRTFNRNGSAVFTLVAIPDDEHLVFDGAKIRSEDDRRCYVRFSPMLDPAPCAGEKPADKNYPAGNLKN